ncbi:hypothetical protein D2U73_03710 [Escherichia coli]|nr:hypothetical protein [Escherichia coli]
MTDFGGKTSIFSHPVYLFLRKFSLQDSRGGSMHLHYPLNSLLLSGYTTAETAKTRDNTY